MLTEDHRDVLGIHFVLRFVTLYPAQMLNDCLKRGLMDWCKSTQSTTYRAEIAMDMSFLRPSFRICKDKREAHLGSRCT